MVGVGKENSGIVRANGHSRGSRSPHSSNELEEIVKGLNSKDTKSRLRATTNLESFLADQRGEVDEHWGEIEGCLKRCVKDNNFRVCIKALNCLRHIVDCFGENFRPICGTWLPLVVDRMGDGKQGVRDAAIEVCLCVMQSIGSRATWRFALGPAFKHKKWRVKETVARLCIKALLVESSKEFPDSVPLGISNESVVPLLSELLCDSNKPVRDVAVETLVVLHDCSMGPSIFSELKKTGVRENLRQMVSSKINDPTRKHFMEKKSTKREQLTNAGVGLVGYPTNTSIDTETHTKKNTSLHSEKKIAPSNSSKVSQSYIKQRNPTSALSKAASLAREIISLDPMPLRDPDHDGWHGRQAALKRIGDMAREENLAWCLSTEFPAARAKFVASLREIMPGLLHNIADLVRCLI